MKEYIEKAVALNALTQSGVTCNMRAHKIVASIQAADVAEVRHGRWNVVEALSNDIQTAGECNICGENISWFGKLPNYCPNCGARMDKEDEREVG